MSSFNGGGQNGVCIYTLSVFSRSLLCGVVRFYMLLPLLLLLLPPSIALWGGDGGACQRARIKVFTWRYIVYCTSSSSSLSVVDEKIVWNVDKEPERVKTLLRLQCDLIGDDDNDGGDKTSHNLHMLSKWRQCMKTKFLALSASGVSEWGSLQFLLRHVTHFFSYYILMMMLFLLLSITTTIIIRRKSSNFFLHT